MKLLKLLIPDRPRKFRILRGPFSGGVVVVNPRSSLRKILGLYEAELNPWLRSVLPRVNVVVDVGANDGYFSFGCAGAFRRIGRDGHVLAFEPEPEHVESLRLASAVQPDARVKMEIVQAFVGARPAVHTCTLNQYSAEWLARVRDGALVKIDVEGAEAEVLDGAAEWIRPKTYFLIEVHRMEFLETLPALFAARGLRLRQINQRALPLLGRESRSIDNWWLVSDL